MCPIPIIHAATSRANDNAFSNPDCCRIMEGSTTSIRKGRPMRPVVTLCLILLAFPTALAADARTAREMYVKAELLRRADVCAVGQQGGMNPIEQALAWDFLKHLEKARQLRPLWPALSDPQQLTESQRQNLVRCLEKWKKAARIEQTILKQYQETEAAFELAKTRRLTPSDVNKIINLVEARSEENPEPGYKPNQENAMDSLLEGETYSDE
mgnify:CR=1 FL=1